MSINQTLRKHVLDRDNRVCVKCYRASDLEVHHITSKQDGGEDSLENLITLCEHCHAEWGCIETRDTQSFYDWLNMPTINCFRAWYKTLKSHPNLRKELSADECLNLVDLTFKCCKDFHGGDGQLHSQESGLQRQITSRIRQRA